MEFTLISISRLLLFFNKYSIVSDFLFPWKIQEWGKGRNSNDIDIEKFIKWRGTNWYQTNFLSIEFSNF